MVSDSRDGEYITRVAESFGNKIIRGSTSKGATRATRQALKLLRSGSVMSLTPDGPRGPAHKMQIGGLWLAALSQCPLVPLHIEVDRQWRFNSWDGQKIPKPFATIHAYLGDPILIDRAELEANPDEVTQLVEAGMMRNTNAARVAAGHPPIPTDQES